MQVYLMSPDFYHLIQDIIVPRPNVTIFFLSLDVSSIGDSAPLHLSPCSDTLLVLPGNKKLLKAKHVLLSCCIAKLGTINKGT